MRAWNVSLALMLSLVACGDRGTSGGPDGGTGGSAGSSSTSSSSTSTGDNGCAGGICVLGPPINFTNPILVWLGDEANAPPCPASAPKLAFEGHATLTATTVCPTCTCGTPSGGSCSLPSTMTANAATCALNNASTPHTPFDPPTGWSGACDTNDSIPSGKLCSGVKCVQSLTIAPLTANEGTSCAPSPTSAPPQPPPTWGGEFGRACKRFPDLQCTDPSMYCLPAAPPGFRACIYTTDDAPMACSYPEVAPYTERHVLYLSVNIDDARSCTPCTCGPPSGATCSSTISIYSDGACSTLAYSATVGSTAPDCHDLPAGLPLGSRSATPPTYTPGTCTPSGGQPMGAAVPIHPGTFCCMP